MAEVAITGVGIFAPGGRDLGLAVKGLRRAIPACAPITRFNTAHFRTRLAYQVSNEPARPDDLIVAFAREAGRQALTQAGMSIERVTNLFVGTAVANSWAMEQCFGALSSFASSAQGRDPVGAVSFSKWIGEACPGLGAPPVVVSTGCTASIDAIGEAAMAIEDGADNALVIGAEAPITPMVVAAFDRIGALTKEQDRPSSASIPFCHGRSGFCIGEGAAALVLEPMRRTRARGARPLGIIRGYASTSSAFHMTAIESHGSAIRLSIRDALIRAEVAPSEIDLLIPHATSTIQNDQAEYAAFTSLFGEKAIPELFLGKRYFGHALGASNIIELVAAIAVMKQGFLPPTAPAGEHECEFDGLTLRTRHSPFRGKLAVKNSSGFSGIHSALVYEGLE
jgi:3-oxoacyl-(acyl-carrier-protein) synthase